MSKFESVKPASPEGLSDKEKLAQLFVVKLSAPREEYKSGELKLNFEHRFSTGEVFKAKEDEGGIASVVIEKDGKTLINLKDYAAPGCEFVAPKFLKNIQEFDKNEIGWWGTTQRGSYSGINMGDMRDPRSIFAFLHELGHTHQEVSNLKMAASYKDIKLTEKQKKMLVGETSEGERNAWARAIYVARDIKSKHGINLFEAFGSFEEFKLFMYGALISYRVLGGKLFGVGTDDILKKTWNIVKEKLFGVEWATEEQRYVGRLFDKMKFRK